MKQVVSPQIEPTQRRFHFTSTSKQTKKEIDTGVRDLEAVTIQALLNEYQLEDLVRERVSYFHFTFRTLVDLAYEKKNSTYFRNIPPIPIVISTPTKMTCRNPRVPVLQKAKVIFFTIAFLEQLKLRTTNLISQITLYSRFCNQQYLCSIGTRKIYEKIIDPFHKRMPQLFGSIILHTLLEGFRCTFGHQVQPSTHKLRFRLTDDDIIAKNDGGLHITVKDNVQRDWHLENYTRALPVVSLEVMLL